MKAPSPEASWFSLPRWFHGLRFGWEQLVHLHHDPPNREEVEVPFRREEAPGAKARIHRHHLGFGHSMDGTPKIVGFPPKSSISIGFSKKPSILGYPFFWKLPYWLVRWSCGMSKELTKSSCVYCNTWNISTTSRSLFHGKSSLISWIKQVATFTSHLCLMEKIKSSSHPTLRSSTNGWSKDSIDLQLSNDPFLLKGFFTAKLLDSFRLTIGH